VKSSQIVEAVLFASDAPLKAEEIARADESLDEDRVEEAIRELTVFYDETERGFQIAEVAEGYQILTRSEFSSYLERFDTVPRPSRLSGPALETLAIIAYRQPIGRVEIEYIRGVGSAGVIRSLQDRALVDVVGRGEGLGRPLLYGTTARFLEHFGFASLDDLPRPDELPVVLRDRVPLGLDDDDDEADQEAAQLSIEGGEAESAPGQEEAGGLETAEADAGPVEGPAEAEVASSEAEAAFSEPETAFAEPEPAPAEPEPAHTEPLEESRPQGG
jgi:segregation and condensation protein B